MVVSRCLVQRPVSWYVEKADSLFRDHNPSYGVEEEENWRLEGEDNIYKAVYNLVNHRDKLSFDKEIATSIKTAVLLRLVIKTVQRSS